VLLPEPLTPSAPPSFAPRCAIVLLLLLAPGVERAAAQAPDAARPRVGVAFGGGSAKGLAHVGVVRWLEEHRIPIDLVAGTSMGGLIGGGYAAGLSASELTALLEGTDWDEMFGFSSFAYKNIRRKEDGRDFPSRIELGLKGGMSLPLALNNGQQVDFLLARIAGPYMTLASFDDLPTPFRTIAVDLVTAQQVVLDRGSLATAMRATMSLPGVFPPVERDGRVLVDGGAMNNVPADVVRAMGADVVIAINVGFMGDTRTVSRSLLGLMSQTVDVMMQASTRESLKSADIIINPELEEFASLDWRRNAELAAAGYQAAEAARDRLLPHAVTESQWAAYQEQRRSRRKTAWAVPAFVDVVGAVPSDRARMERLLAARVGQPLDVPGLEADLETLTGLDRYETVGWQMEEAAPRGVGLRVEARPKSHAPPFLMLGISLQNTTSNDFAFQLAGRYLAFDVAGSGSEVRVDAAIGAQPRAGAELYYPIGGSAVFVTGAAGVRRETVNFVSDGIIVARYSEDRESIGFDAGLNLGRDGDVRAGLGYGHLEAAVEAGDPQLPELRGPETRARLQWRHDGQDSPVVPSRGLRATGTIVHILDTPEPPPEFGVERSNQGITQAELRGSMFWSPGGRHRAFLAGGLGTTWGHPLATEQFELGTPFRLGAYDMGELRGDHYGVVTLGYLRGVARLPDFLGGPIFLGGWVENGSAFNEISDAKFRTNVSVGVLADTLVGPILVGGSFDPNGAWRYYIGVGRLF
jgi:NTE family protein